MKYASSNFYSIPIVAIFNITDSDISVGILGLIVAWIDKIIN